MEQALTIFALTLGGALAVFALAVGVGCILRDLWSEYDDADH